MLSRWNPPYGAVEMATVRSVPVLLFKIRCMFFFIVKTCLCALSEEATLSFSSLSANPFLWRPLVFHMPCLVRLFDFLSQRHNRLCHFISDIMDYFLTGEDQQQTKVSCSSGVCPSELIVPNKKEACFFVNCFTLRKSA